MSENQISRLTFTNIPSTSPLMDNFQIKLKDYHGVIYKIDRKKKLVEIGIARRHLQSVTNFARECNLQPV